MKKICILCGGMFIFFTACGSNTSKVIEGTVQNNVIENTATESSVPVEDMVQNIEKQEEPQAAETEQKGYIFSYKDIFIEIDAEAEAIIMQLGEPSAYFEAPSCAFNGVDKLYTYNGFELNTYPLDGKDYVSAILFKDDTVTTMEGICIGDSVERMQEVYGDNATEENGMTVYRKDGMKLCFVVENGKITSIEYQTTILDE